MYRFIFGSRQLGLAALLACSLAFPSLAEAQGGKRGGADRRVKEALDEAGLHYSVQDQGVFALSYRFQGGGTHIVYISSLVSQTDDGERRTVFSPVATSERPLSAAVKKKIAEANKRLAKTPIMMNKEQTAAFLVMLIDPDAEAPELKAAVEHVVTTAFGLTKSLKGSTPVDDDDEDAPRKPRKPSKDDDEETPRKPSKPSKPSKDDDEMDLTGSWKVTFKDGSGSMTLTLKSAGTFSLKLYSPDGDMTEEIKGRYTLEDDTLRLVASNKKGWKLEGTVKSTSASRFTLTLPDGKSVVLTRAGAAK